MGLTKNLKICEKCKFRVLYSHRGARWGISVAEHSAGSENVAKSPQRDMERVPHKYVIDVHLNFKVIDWEGTER